MYSSSLSPFTSDSSSYHFDSSLSFFAKEEHSYVNSLNNTQGWSPFDVSVDPTLVFKPQVTDSTFADVLLDNLKNLSLENDSDSNCDTKSETDSPAASSECSDDSDSLDETHVKSVTLYKTEMCDSFMTTGHCRYHKKCKFAHGLHELRPVPRHPKYKSILCRNFWESGFCPYGKRCCFLHKTMAESEFTTYSSAQASLKSGRKDHGPKHLA